MLRGWGEREGVLQRGTVGRGGERVGAEEGGRCCEGVDENSFPTGDLEHLCDLGGRDGPTTF